METEYEYGLNGRQTEAANHLYGPALVLAGPGSGKTSVITARTINLVENHSVKPERLLTVTFSRAAAEEMKRRYVTKTVNSKKAVPEYSTLHSFCLTSLMYCEEYNKKKRRVLCDGGEKSALLTAIWNRINASEYDMLTFDYLELISNTISKIKCFKGSEKESDLRKEIQIRNFDEIFNAYERYKTENYLIDFDDMLSEMVHYLKYDDLFRKRLTEKYDFIQVDEGQDLSYLQIEIIKDVCPAGNVFMVADDDQGIYGFRGADVSVLKFFEKSFSGCKKYYLEQNYRSCGKIVTTASSFIRRNSARYDKNIFTVNAAGADIELLRAYDISAQARFAAEIALANSAAGLTCGILYRKNISALMPLLYLYIFANRKGIKASYGISGDFVIPDKYEIVKEFLERAEENDEYPFYKSKNMADVFGEMERDGLIEEYRALQSLKGQSEKDTEYILNYTKRLSKEFKTYGQLMEFFCWLKQTHEGGNAFFSTVHSSKGLEYDCVVIIDASEDDFPKKTADSLSELEEERRLFYVAMTRAMNKLYIITPNRCGKFTCNPGLFFRETEEVLKA